MSFTKKMTVATLGLFSGLMALSAGAAEHTTAGIQGAPSFCTVFVDYIRFPIQGESRAWYVFKSCDTGAEKSIIPQDGNTDLQFNQAVKSLMDQGLQVRAAVSNSTGGLTRVILSR
jgi:hypothetical protein